LRIRRLKLSGFKSFVEPAELRIEPGLTGVVGPNGCGKSNLLEAIRWVMGEGSPKSLRGDGMEDVIFAGTATRPARDFAEVSILIERDGGEEAAAGDGEVTRRIERGAGSAYRIDGRDVRAKDVSLLFADAATGAHSPALVSQGKVGAIIASKPTERRLLLEEAAGISGLHARRKDAEQKLRAAEANLARLSEILGEQEQRAAALRRQARAAERYRQLTDKIRGGGGASGPCALGRGRCRGGAGDPRCRRGRAGGRAAPRCDGIGSRRAAASRGAARRAPQRTADARARGSEIAHRLATARARRDTIARRISELERLEAASEADIGREEALKADAAAAIAQIEQERDLIERRLSDEEGHSAHLAKELGELESKSRDCEAALADLLARHAAMRAERRVAEASLEAARAHAARVEAERDKLKQPARRASPTWSQSDRDRDEAAARANAAEKARAEAEAALRKRNRNDRRQKPAIPPKAK
jgi:chromosome segregation protein